MDAFRFFLTDLVAVLGLYDKVLVAERLQGWPLSEEQRSCPILKMGQF